MRTDNGRAPYLQLFVLFLIIEDTSIDTRLLCITALLVGTGYSAMPSVKSALVTGSAGLIGSEMVRQLAAGKTALGQPRYIFACHRASDDVRELKKIAERAPNGIKIHLICFGKSDFSRTL